MLSEACFEDREVVPEFVRAAEGAHVGEKFVHEGSPARVSRCQVFDARTEIPDDAPVADDLEYPVAENQQARVRRNLARLAESDRAVYWTLVRCPAPIPPML